MYLKVINKMLSEGRVTDLANYIKSGENVEEAFLMIESDRLAQNGVTLKSLEKRGAILSLSQLIQKFEAELKHTKMTNETKAKLKHYVFVLGKAMQLWKENKLGIKCLELDVELDNRMVNYLQTVWDNYIKKDVELSCPIVRYLEDGIDNHVNILVRSVNTGKIGPQVSDEQIRHYSNLLAAKLLEAWSGPESGFEKIKSHLDEKLKDLLLSQAKTKNLGEVMMTEIEKKFRESLVNHMSIMQDFHRFPGLSEKYSVIYRSFQGNDVVNLMKDFREKTFDKLVENYQHFDKQASMDTNNIMRDEVLPHIIANLHIPVELKKAVIISVIADQRKNAINLDVGQYIQMKLNAIVADEVSHDIRHDRGLFKGVIEQKFRQVVCAYKKADAQIVGMMPEVGELFSDLESLVSRGKARIDALSHLQNMETQIRDMKSQLQAMTNRISAIERPKVDKPSSNKQEPKTEAKEPALSFFGNKRSN
jgi:hypothetical protein